MKNLNKKEIEALLPHRDPMLLIDELHDIKKLTSATGIVNVKKDSFFCSRAFPRSTCNARWFL
jgi:3-hydroxyacyl-[acyl-carrier-protein] dehydratase